MTESLSIQINDRPENSLEPGLYLVPSPLGHLGDLTLRVIQTLKTADLVLAEDTRRTLKLLNHLNIRCPMISYREQNHKLAWPKAAKVLEAGGRVALVTDAGSPVVSDPGAALVHEARAAGYPIIPLPGPSAVITALTASGFSADRFTFGGFIPARNKERRDFLKNLARHPWTLVFFETPHRLAESLADLAEIFGPRPALLAREMTKVHEEYLAADLAALAQETAARPRKGEITLVVSGWIDEGEEKPLDLQQLAQIARQDSRPTKVVAAELAAQSGRSRNEIYQLLLAARQAEVEE